MAHLVVGVLGMRAAAHFAEPAMDYQTFDYADTAEGALAQLARRPNTHGRTDPAHQPRSRPPRRRDRAARHHYQHQNK